jgi:hypothetical protein
MAAWEKKNKATAMRSVISACVRLTKGYFFIVSVPNRNDVIVIVVVNAEK